MQHRSRNVSERGEKVGQQALAQIIMLGNGAEKQVAIELIRQPAAQDGDVENSLGIGSAEKIGINQAEIGVQLVGRLINDIRRGVAAFALKWRGGKTNRFAVAIGKPEVEFFRKLAAAGDIPPARFKFFSQKYFRGIIGAE